MIAAGRARDHLVLSIAPPAPDAWLLVESLHDGVWHSTFCACSPADVRVRLERLREFEIRVGVTARKARDRELLHDCAVLWAVVESGRSVQTLSRMRPRPTLVLAEGDTVRRTALWALHRPLSWEWTIRANRRLAHFLGSPKKYTAPTHAVYLPGSYLYAGRVMGQPVVCVEQNDARYHARDVVGHLREAPDPDAWRNRREAA